VAGTTLAVFGGALWLIPLALAVFIVPKFMAVFAKVEVELPVVTVAVLAGAKAVAHWWPLAAAVWLLAVGDLVALSVTVRGWLPVALAGTFAGLSVLGMAWA
jgi:type II secretory pathway component PulF